MPKQNLIRTADFPYHLTARSNNREFFYLDLEELWWIFMKNLSVLQRDYGCEIQAFVLMSNHYHLMMVTPRENLGESMQYLQRETARRANYRTERVNHFFGGRYKWSLVNQEIYYWHALKYIYRNPVRAGMCERVEDYKFSSLNRSAWGFDWRLTDYFFDRAKTIELDRDWLNQSYPGEQEMAVQKALRRREFKPPTDKSGRPYAFDIPQRKKGVVSF